MYLGVNLIPLAYTESITRIAQKPLIRNKRSEFQHGIIWVYSSRRCDLLVDCIHVHSFVVKDILTKVHTITPVSNSHYSYRHTVLNSIANCARDMCTYEPLPKLPDSAIVGDQFVALNPSLTAALVPAHEG